MLNTLGIVEVNGSTSEADGPPSGGMLAGRRFGGKSLLEWVVRRVTDCQQLDQVVVVCSERRLEQHLRQYAPPDVSVFVGRSFDPLSCLADATRDFLARAVVRVSVCSPFIDPALIDRLVSSADSHGACDYVSYSLGDGRPAVLSQIGVLAEWCSSSALQRADQDATDPLDRLDATRYVYRHPEWFQLRLIPVPPELDRDDLRLGIDLEEDWEHAQLIYDALGPESLEWQRIAGLLDHHPAMRQRMAMLNRTKVIS